MKYCDDVILVYETLELVQIAKIRNRRINSSSIKRVLLRLFEYLYNALSEPEELINAAQKCNDIKALLHLWLYCPKQLGNSFRIPKNIKTCVENTIVSKLQACIDSQLDPPNTLKKSTQQNQCGIPTADSITLSCDYDD